jgi:hypothetical protein
VFANAFSTTALDGIPSGAVPEPPAE